MYSPGATLRLPPQQKHKSTGFFGCAHGSHSPGFRFNGPTLVTERLTNILIEVETRHQAQKQMQCFSSSGGPRVPKRGQLPQQWSLACGGSTHLDLAVMQDTLVLLWPSALCVGTDLVKCGANCRCLVSFPTVGL